MMSSTGTMRKISPPTAKSEDPDPGQLLNEWLGELDNLQKVSKVHLENPLGEKRVNLKVIDTFDNRIDEAKPIDFDSGPHVSHRNNEDGTLPTLKFTLKKFTI